MVISKQTQLPTVFDVRQLIKHGAPDVSLHRGCGEHISAYDSSNQDDSTCWCDPLTLDANEVRRIPLRTLAIILAEHYAVQ